MWISSLGFRGKYVLYNATGSKYLAIKRKPFLYHEPPCTLFLFQHRQNNFKFNVLL